MIYKPSDITKPHPHSGSGRQAMLNADVRPFVCPSVCQFVSTEIFTSCCSSLTWSLVMAQQSLATDGYCLDQCGDTLAMSDPSSSTCVCRLRKLIVCYRWSQLSAVLASPAGLFVFFAYSMAVLQFRNRNVSL